MKLQLKQMDTYYKQGLQILQQAKADLGNSDPVSEKLESTVSTVLSAYNHVESIVSRGRIIEKCHLPWEGRHKREAIH